MLSEFTRWTALATTAALGWMMAGCATAKPSEELVDARKTYQEAKQSKAAELEPDELVDARQALLAAEQAHKDEPAGVEERHLAYLAKRRAEIAMARAERSALRNQYEERHQQVVSQAKSYALTAKDQLSTANQELQARAGQIERTEAELGEERERRKQAEELAAKALTDLKEVAMVKEESRGYVITLSGAVLFKSGESELLQTARHRLKQVADALKQQDSKQIVIEGHTDSRGSESYNQQLSLARAQAVKDYLESEGIDSAWLTAKGMGEGQPIAENSSPEGRANNRRVEIIVQGGQGN